jgi:N-acetylmuramic acid 6-phosphate (MurNAc-6-P) etherase
VKVAAVMGVTGLDQTAAQRALAKAKGRLDRAKGFTALR